MRISIILKNKFSFVSVMLALLIGVGIFATSVAAQKVAPLANPDLDQCANGPQTAAKLPCTGSNWQNGNLNGNNSQYVEGESVSYRAAFTGAPNSASSLTIQWDTTKSGKRALDYLTTYDRSNPIGNDPCDGVAVCDPLVFDTEMIPTDVDVTNGPNGVPGGGDDITQVPGVFTLFGGTITSVSAYGLSGLYTGDSTRSITVNFTFDANGSVVLAWGAHISIRSDWGVGNTAIAISGAPYHVEVGGSNCSMQVDAVIVPASVTIVKLVTNFNLTYYSTISFGFTTSTGAPTLPGSFQLTDSDPAPFGGGTIANSSVVAFGAANTLTVTEDIDPLNIYTLANITCSEVGGGIPPVLNTTTNFLTRTVTIIPDEAEFITCTFSNTQLGPTAARVSVSGRVLTFYGAAVTRARVMMTDPEGNVRTSMTNNFGYYRFDDVEAGNTYVFNVTSKQYQFSPRVVTLDDELSNLDFVAF